MNLLLLHTSVSYKSIIDSPNENDGDIHGFFTWIVKSIIRSQASSINIYIRLSLEGGCGSDDLGAIIAEYARYILYGILNASKQRNSLVNDIKFVILMSRSC